MEPQQVIRTIRRRWRPIVLLALLGAVLGAASSAVAEDVGPLPVPVVRYDACHTLLVDTALPNDVPQWSVRNLAQLAERVVEGKIPETVATTVDQDLATVSSRARVGVRNDIGSLVVCGVGETPNTAEELADTFAATLVAVLEADAQEWYDASVASANDRIANAQACVDAATESLDALTGDGDDPSTETSAEVDALDQQRSLCDLQLIQARTNEINLTSGGVPVVPFETLSAASAVEIPQSDYQARIREGAAGANVIIGTAETVGTASPTTAGGAARQTTLPGGALPRALVGLVGGLVLGAAWVHFSERFDSRLRRKEDVEATLDLPVLVEIPPLSRADRKLARMVAVEEPRSRAAESYRALRSALDYAHMVDKEQGRADAGAQVILVTSGGPSEGKTTTLANLAVVMAEGGRSVLAINCDFRRPRLHQYLGGETAARHLNVTDVPGVQMVTQVTRSDADSTPSVVVAAQRRLIERARRRFDVILLDTAPILTTNDAAEVLAMADHVVLVVGAGKTKVEAAARATELLERRGRPPLGVVLVGAREVPNSSDYYYSDDDPYLVRSSKGPENDSLLTVEDASTSGAGTQLEFELPGNVQADEADDADDDDGFPELGGTDEFGEVQARS